MCGAEALAMPPEFLVVIVNSLDEVRAMSLLAGLATSPGRKFLLGGAKNLTCKEDAVDVLRHEDADNSEKQELQRFVHAFTSDIVWPTYTREVFMVYRGARDAKKVIDILELSRHVVGAGHTDFATSDGQHALLREFTVGSPDARSGSVCYVTDAEMRLPENHQSCGGCWYLH